MNMAYRYSEINRFGGGNRMRKRLTGLVLAVLMLASLFVMGIQPAVADSTPINQEIVQGGAILHCFDWSYNEIRANLQDIKDAGYVAVQTSPVQPAKDFNAAWTDTGGNWWKLYQPLGLRIAGESESWLGTKEELTALCNEAESLGIYVIVDIVANHVANKTGGGYTVNGVYNVSDQVDEVLQDRDGSKQYYHTSENGVNDGSRYNMTQYHLSMPDLNTGNDEIQDMVLDLLKECVNCGVDGFRFDAAKHIELPGDAGCGSDFWPFVLDGVRSYASSKGRKLYIYGESLSGSGSDAWVGEFISYMALTDNGTGNTARGAVCDQNAGLLAVPTYQRGDSPKDYVLWAESHDTYLEDNGTSGVPSEKIVRTWAIVGARAESTALYLARPNELMGKASTDTAWKSPAVAEVNKFKTYYAGKGEWMSYNQEAKITWLERGEANNGAGVVIAKLDGAGWVENLEVHLMSDGVYADSVSGNIFAVEGGKLRGTVGPTGVAVVYKTSTEPAPTAPSTGSQKLYLKPNSNWLQQGARFAVYTFGGGEHWYPMTEVDATEHIYEAEITNPYTNVVFCRMNPATTDNNWSNKWNQSADLTVPSDKNLFIPTEGVWDNMTESWGVYGDVGGGTNPIPVTEDEGYYLVGTMTGWSVLPEYKMTRTGAATEEYTIDVPLIRVSTPAFHSQFKVVYSPDGVTAQTWFPGGDQNNYGDFEGEIPMSGIYSVYFRPNYDGEAGWHVDCIYAERTKYFVTVDTMDKNGTVSVDKDIAAAGEIVTVTATPNAGCELESLVYLCETGLGTGVFTTTEITGNTFQMPAENATVKATFRDPSALNLADGYYLVDNENPAVENINPANKLELCNTDGHLFNGNYTFMLTGNFGEATYRIVRVKDLEIAPFSGNKVYTVNTTGVTETVYFEVSSLTSANPGVSSDGCGVSSLTGFFLNLGNKRLVQITDAERFAETETPGVYAVEHVLYGGSRIFVFEAQDGRFIQRYPNYGYMDTANNAMPLDTGVYGNSSYGALYNVYFRPDCLGDENNGWFKGCISVAFSSYYILIDDEIEHGVVTASNLKPQADETITLTITPDEGYVLDTLRYINLSNYRWTTLTSNVFVMPAAPIGVAATFKLMPTFTVSVDPAIADKVTANPTSAHEGDTVSLTVADGADFCKLQIQYTLSGEAKTEDVTGNSFTMPAANVTVVAVDHAYGEPTYTWTETQTGYSVTAKAVCANNASHEITETVNATYAVVTPATGTAEGVGRYTATFSDPHFTAQTKDVAIPKITVTYYGATANALDVYVREDGEILYRYDIRVKNLPGGKVDMDSAQIFLTFDHSILSFRRAEGPVGWTIGQKDEKLLLTWASNGSVEIKEDDIVLTLYFALNAPVEEQQLVFIRFTENALGVGSTLSYLKDGKIEEIRVATIDGSILFEATMLGDANCDGRITTADAALILRALVGSDALSAHGAWNADVDGDGSITAEDAVLILRYIVELIDAFPAA